MMRFGVRKRAYDKGVELTDGNSVVPMTWTLDLENKWLLRYLVRLDRIARGLKPFKRPQNTDISIYGTPQDSDWYCEFIGCARGEK